jgi:hypothetical protein
MRLSLNTNNNYKIQFNVERDLMQNGKGHERPGAIEACATQGSFGERNI